MKRPSMAVVLGLRLWESLYAYNYTIWVLIFMDSNFHRFHGAFLSTKSLNFICTSCYHAMKISGMYVWQHNYFYGNTLHSFSKLDWYTCVIIMDLHIKLCTLYLRMYEIEARYGTIFWQEKSLANCSFWSVGGKNFGKFTVALMFKHFYWKL